MRDSCMHLTLFFSMALSIGTNSAWAFAPALTGSTAAAAWHIQRNSIVLSQNPAVVESPVLLFSEQSSETDVVVNEEESSEDSEETDVVVNEEESGEDSGEADVVVNEVESIEDSEESLPEEEQEEDSQRGPNRKRHTVFVGNLPFDTTDTQLRDLFAEQGTVELVSIPRDREKGTSRGFAFVDMSTPEEVATAVAALHQTDYGGRSIRVQESLPKDEAKGQAKKTDVGTQKLYVGNLSFDSTREDVEEYFAQFGDVKEVYLPMNADTGNPRGFAFVTLDEASAAEAIAETNGQEFQGRPLVVSLPLPRGEKTPRPQREPRQKLYIGNLSFYTVADTIRELFEEFGTVHDCYLPEDPETGGSRGFGFVTVDKDAAQAAIDGTDGCELDGRIIRVNEAQAKGSPRKKDQNDSGDTDWLDSDTGSESSESSEY